MEEFDEAISAARLTRIIEHSSNEVYVIDARTFRFLFVNEGARKNLGYPMAELRELTPLDVKPDLSMQVWERLIRPIRDGLRPVTQFVTRHRRKDGGVYDVSVTLEYMADEDPAIMVAFIEDLTIRQHAEETLRENRALLASVMETAPDAVITIDSDAHILSFSAEAERLFHYDAEDVIGKNVSILMPKSHAEAHDGYMRRYLQTGEKRIIGIGRQVSARRKDGHVFPMELAVGEVRHGERHIFTGFIRDITRRVTMQNRMDALQRELNHASRLTAMGEMAAALAHEINQPLTAITNYANVVERTLSSADADTSKAAEYTKRIGEQALRAGDIIRRLRGFVQHVESDPKTENVSEVVREACELATLDAATKGIRIVYDFADDLPLIKLDRIQIQQVVVNLVRNGMDAIADARDRTVDIATWHRDAPKEIGIGLRAGKADCVHISVHDAGPGIDPQVIDRLFEPFVTTKEDGMGIGLSVSRSIVEAHGGEITAENDEQGGARFTLSLPVNATIQ